MRLGELLGLRWTAINWRGSYINVTRAIVKGVETSPKNRKARQVNMSRDLRAVLYLRWRRLRRSDLVFPSRVGTPLQPGNVRRAWSQILDAAELGIDRTPHAMRHTHSSLLIAAGENPSWVAAQAGRSLAETMRTYVHFVPTSNRVGADRLAELLGSKTTRGFSEAISGSQRQRTATKLRSVSRGA